LIARKKSRLASRGFLYLSGSKVAGAMPGHYSSVDASGDNLDPEDNLTAI
jgi:hypothetical protein